MNFLEVSGVTKQNEANFLLQEISFSQRKFQRIAIAGETGSGKSTLLKIIAGLVQPDTGQVIFEGEKVKGPHDTLVPGHPSIAYLSQDYELAKFLTVDQVLSYANHLSDESAQIIFEVCRIDHLLSRKTDQLSGGERQRIAIARLLISSPRLLLLDEPFSNLDAIYRGILKAVIKDIGRRLKITCILVSHEPMDTLSWASKILVMRNGTVIQKGPPEKIYRQPVDEYTAGLFGRYNLIPASAWKPIVNHIKVKTGQQNVLLRPEDFKVVSRSKNSFPVEVRRINFLGSSYEVEAVLANGHQVVIQSNKPDYVKGDTIHLSINSNEVHFIKTKNS
jgi:ABC-type sugar transport system ATPase subunit